MIDKAPLLNKLNLLKESLPKNEWWFYNIESIENFIEHLHGIADERERVKTAIEIDKYLDVVNVIKFKNNKFKNHKYLEKHLQALSRPFFWDAGFVVKPNLFLCSIALVIIFVTLNIFFDFILSVLASLIIAVAILIYYVIRLKGKRYY